jgi:hypothetical protein
MKKANENQVALNFAPVDEQYRQLTDTFEVYSLTKFFFQ